MGMNGERQGLRNRLVPAPVLPFHLYLHSLWRVFSEGLFFAQGGFFCVLVFFKLLSLLCKSDWKPI